jgi:monofunctional biosynthetic peptidoglycan transglycosylase
MIARVQSYLASCFHPVNSPLMARAQTHFLRRAARWLFMATIAFVGLSLLWVAFYRFVPPPVTMTMLTNAVDGRGITKDWMPLSKMDRDMARAVIAAEDANFCTHHGFELNAILKAAEHNAQGKKLRGGSTISQQTAKNAFLWQGRSWLRKGLEAWFTVLIEAIWGKRRIMEVYLNIAETGIGTYGANAGAMRYFNHDASRLSPSEAARIAAVLPLPKTRAAIAPAGVTARYGRSIERRMGVVARDRLDRCLD